MKVLGRNFFNRATRKVAKELLGKILVRNYRGKRLAGRIVETEAYLGKNDPASHACRKITPRNIVMFGPPGVAYVYLCYGFHYMLNAVTEKNGKAGAVLIRGVEPLTVPAGKAANGPGKLTKLFKITKKQNGRVLALKTGLYIASDGMKPLRIRNTVRIGIKKGAELPFRYYIEGKQHVSGK